MEQGTETVFAGHLLHERHEEHVVVNGKVCLLEDWSKLKLVWRNLVVTSLARNAEFESANLKILHECLYSVRNGTEIVVFHLLVLC